MNGTRTPRRAAIGAEQLASPRGHGDGSTITSICRWPEHGHAQRRTCRPRPPRCPLGGDANGGTGFAGEIDELEISKAARPAGFIKVAAMNQGRGQGVEAADVRQRRRQGRAGSAAVSSASFSVRSPIDGWLVICVLVVMSAISWVVMVNKARYLNATIKGNAQFFKIGNTSRPI